MISALVFEWRRLWSVRATWAMVICYVSSVTFFGVFPLVQSPQPNMQSWDGFYNTSGNFFSIIFLSVVAAQVFGHEYRYGTIRLTLTEFPKREIVMFAKSFILLAFTSFAFAISHASLWLFAKFVDAGVITDEAEGFTFSPNPPTHEWKVFLYVLAYAFIALSLVAITRNLLLGVVIPLIMSLILEQILGLLNQLAKQKFDWLIHRLPFDNANDWLADGGQYTSPGLTFAAWVIGLYLLATVLFFKRDA